MEINSATSMMDGNIKIEETELEMGIEEIMNTLSSESLVSVTVGDFLVIMRSDFDLTISGEPYTGLVMLLNLTTGKYFSRIWNQTVDTGYIVHAGQLLEACEHHFGKGRPCLGCPEEEEEKHANAEFLISQTPIPRRIAKACQKFLGKNAHSSASSCSECIKLSDSGLSGANDACEGFEIPSPSRTLIKNAAPNESSISIKTEYNEEHVDVEEIVIKPEILSDDDFPDSDNIDYGETHSQAMKQENKDPLGVGNKGSSTGNDNKKFKCHLCPHRSAKMSNLKQHIVTMHEKIRNHVCQQCGYAAYHKSNLKTHIETVHEKKKDHVCSECGKAFTKKALKVHIQGVHQKIKNHECRECGHAFLQKGDLKRHIERVHEKLGSSSAHRN